MDKEEKVAAEKEHKAKEEKLEEKPPAVEKKPEKPAKDKTKEKKIKKESASSAKKSRLSGMKRLLRPEKKELQLEEKKPETAEEPFTILKFVLMTEKAIQLIEKENKLVFIVDRKCSKDDVKRAAESAFQASVDDVETMIDQKSRKKAFIRFKEPGTAGDIAMRLGII